MKRERTLRCVLILRDKVMISKLVGRKCVALPDLLSGKTKLKRVGQAVKPTYKESGDASSEPRHPLSLGDRRVAYYLHGRLANMYCAGGNSVV
jgi:hypothetical protein